MNSEKPKAPPPLYKWDLLGVDPQTVADMVATFPQPVRTWAGRLLWWDRYAVLNIPAPMFMEWVRDRHTPEPDPLKLAEALVMLGYTEAYAKMRACGGDTQRTSVMEVFEND
jgi:hypothetical protein